MHRQFPRVFKNPIYTRKFTEPTDFTDLTDLQTYRFLVDRSRTISAPGAHPRTRAVYNTKRCGGAGALARVVQDCCVDSFPRAHARGGLGRRGLVCTCSSGVLPVGCGGTGLRSCREAGATRTRACIKIDEVTFRNSGTPTPAVRLGTVRPGGGAGARNHQLVVALRSINFLTGIGRLSKPSRSFYGLPAVGAAATRS